MALYTQTIRQSAVAGRFYSEIPEKLRAELTRFLAPRSRIESGPCPKALIVPHAGYVYSGQSAAHAYATLAPFKDQIRRVVLLGPAHRVRVKGLALPGVEAFATPLGLVRIDEAAATILSALPQITTNREAHAPEHALEVQLPFLQCLLDDFRLVPLVVGEATTPEIANALEAVWGGPETLILVSSDLSHYLDYDAAQKIDTRTIRQVLARESLESTEQACGARPINGLSMAARRHNLEPKLLDLCNSGDTAGDKSRVVGYASVAYYENSAQPSDPMILDRGSLLLRIARTSIASALGQKGFASLTVSQNDHAWLQQQAASFVTLKQGDRLRGCIGSLEAHRTLLADIQHNAQAAALRDPRFSPLTAAELEYTRIEVSLLSPSAALTFQDEEEAIALLRPGIDGLILTSGPHRGTFLPQVWAEIPEPREFLRRLKRKAGLTEDHWSDQLTLHRYSVEKWAEATGVTPG